MFLSLCQTATYSIRSKAVSLLCTTPVVVLSLLLCCVVAGCGTAGLSTAHTAPSGRTHGTALSADTSGVYLTQADFENNLLSYKSVRNIKITGYPPLLKILLKSFIINPVAMPIKLRLLNGEKKLLRPNQLFGYRSHGVKYIHKPHLQEYLSVLSYTPPACLFVRLKTTFTAHLFFSNAFLYFSPQLTDSLTEFTPQNITAHFGQATRAEAVLMELHERIKKEHLLSQPGKKQILRCRALVEQYLAKLRQLPMNLEEQTPRSPG